MKSVLASSGTAVTSTASRSTRRARISPDESLRDSTLAQQRRLCHCSSRSADARRPSLPLSLAKARKEWSRRPTSFLRVRAQSLWRWSRSTAGAPLSIGRTRLVSQRIRAHWLTFGARSMRGAMKFLQPPARSWNNMCSARPPSDSSHRICIDSIGGCVEATLPRRACSSPFAARSRVWVPARWR